MVSSIKVDMHEPYILDDLSIRKSLAIIASAFERLRWLTMSKEELMSRGIENIMEVLSIIWALP